MCHVVSQKDTRASIFEKYQEFMQTRLNRQNDDTDPR